MFVETLIFAVIDVYKRQVFGDVQIAGAEVLPPLGHAVRLVHTDHVDGLELPQSQKARGQQPLRCV